MGSAQLHAEQQTGAFLLAYLVLVEMCHRGEKHEAEAKKAKR